jgi:hypothetical protein
MVSRILAQREDFKISVVAHEPRSGDIHVETLGKRVLIEVKNYRTAVPDTETQKFRRDLGARGADAGVLISLNSEIAKKRGVLSVLHDVIPLDGRVIPLVFVACDHKEVITAAVDIAVHLSKQPTSYASTRLHLQDQLEAYAAGFDEVSALIENTRNEIGQLAEATAGRLGQALEKLGFALRDQRRLIRAQRGDVENCEDVSTGDSEPGEAWRLLSERYAVAGKSVNAVKRILGALDAPHRHLGDIRPAANWRLLKTKARNLATGVAFTFHKNVVVFHYPLAHLPAARIGEIVVRHPKKVQIAEDGLVLSLDLDDSTEAEAFELAGNIS